MERLEAEKNDLTTEIAGLQRINAELKESVSVQSNKILALALRTNRFINDYSVFLDDNGSIDERIIKAKDVFNLFTEEERYQADEWLKQLRTFLNGERLDNYVNRISLTEFTSKDKIEEILKIITKSKQD